MKKGLFLFISLPLIGFGQCKGDCENGYGTYTYANRDKYVGENKDDKRNGHLYFCRQK